jgi:hypothetical protein
MALPQHPASRVPDHELSASFHRWLFATAVVAAVLLTTGDPLRNDLVTAGVFTLELNFGALPAMIASYDAETRHLLGFQLGFDYLFMPLYAHGLCLGLARARVVRGLPLGGTFHLLLWAIWCAAACDAVENAALMLACLGPATAGQGWVATVFAGVKFAILAFGLLVWLAQLRHPKLRAAA